MSTRFRIDKVSGVISAPPSKSSMQRAIAAALLAGGKSVIHNPSFCDDAISAISMARSLGARITEYPDMIEIEGGISPINSALNCGESGLAVRMFSAIAATYPGRITIDGRGSLTKRPVNMIEEPLTSLGVSVRTTNGYLPVEITGPIKGGRVKVDGSQSSQFLTGLLFALPLALEDSIIEVANPMSKPYINVTLSVLSHFGIEVENSDYTLFRIKGRQKFRASEYTVEGDWSGAAFFLIMAAKGGRITIKNLEINSPQADRKIIDVLKLTGSHVYTENDSITVERDKLLPFIFDISDCPDLAPPLAVLAAACSGTSIIEGAGRLSIKESSRGENLVSNLKAMGAGISMTGDRIEICGGQRLKHQLLQSYGDHRMAMAMASAAIITEGGVSVDNTECINKSYPGFASDFRLVGGEVTS
jgi:3-phosphoshikimate 1-carboxyvinyltransferase